MGTSFSSYYNEYCGGCDKKECEEAPTGEEEVKAAEGEEKLPEATAEAAAEAAGNVDSANVEATAEPAE
jgi:hypothetical protein